MDAKSLYNFIMLCLKDDDGISEEAYQSLIEHLLEINQPEIIIELNTKSRTSNGRRYINEY
jgi:dihydrodipicolinate synthase/N-acetylneuraminate lyase